MNKLLWLVLVAVSAQARDVTVSWDMATQRVDGTPLALAEIAATRIEWGTCVGTAFGTVIGTRSVAPPATSTVLALDAGTYCVRGFTEDTDGLVSDASNVAQKVVKGKPRPPVMK